MSVEKIESMEWELLEEKSGNGVIKIELRDLFKPYLLGTKRCTKISIWWSSAGSAHDETVALYAIQETEHLDSGPFVSKVESWYNGDGIVAALEYVRDNLV